MVGRLLIPLLSHLWLTLSTTTTGLNFFRAANETLFNIGDGLAQSVLEAHAAYSAIGRDLFAFEIGNEVDGEPSYGTRPL
jgi:hypothetical protein